ncbi:hypothetical protein NL676_008065 [Syzygium grande]|nr:hypothetical protein NL676_008065 [Syzygium grande]
MRFIATVTFAVGNSKTPWAYWRTVGARGGKETTILISGPRSPNNSSRSHLLIRRHLISPPQSGQVNVQNRLFWSINVDEASDAPKQSLHACRIIGELKLNNDKRFRSGIRPWFRVGRAKIIAHHSNANLLSWTQKISQSR